MSQVCSASTTIGEVGCNGSTCAELFGDFLDCSDIDVVVTGEHIDRYDRGDTVDLHVLELLSQVVATLVHFVWVREEQCIGKRLACTCVCPSGP